MTFSQPNEKRDQSRLTLNKDSCQGSVESVQHEYEIIESLNNQNVQMDKINEEVKMKKRKVKLAKHKKQKNALSQSKDYDAEKATGMY
jgi:hypothetical protein